MFIYRLLLVFSKFSWKLKYLKLWGKERNEVLFLFFSTVFKRWSFEYSRIQSGMDCICGYDLDEDNDHRSSRRREEPRRALARPISRLPYRHLLRSVEIHTPFCILKCLIIQYYVVSSRDPTIVFLLVLLKKFLRSIGKLHEFLSWFANVLTICFLLSFVF